MVLAAGDGDGGGTGRWYFRIHSFLYCRKYSKVVQVLGYFIM